MNLVINSQFRPFTYDEMVKPLAQYKEAYDKIEQDYSDLTTQTEMWKDIVNQTNSPEAYEMYQRYSNDLAAITEDFSKGMNINNRRALLGMKRRYAQDITPIAMADAAMKAANELRAKASPDAIFEVGEYNSLDQFLHGKTANNNYTSRDALTKKTAAMTEAAMAEALQDPEFEKYMGDQFWLITQHTGGSYKDLMAAISNNPQAQSRFAQIKQRVMADAGMDKYDSRGRAAIEDAINTGLYAGLDKPVRSFQANQDHITPLQRHSMANDDARLALSRAQFNLSAASAGMEWDKDEKKWVYNPDVDPALKKATTVAEIKAAHSGSKGGSGSTRKSVATGPGFIDTKNPDKSRRLGSDEVNTMVGTPISYKSFTKNEKGEYIHAKDDKVNKKTGERLEVILKNFFDSDDLQDILEEYTIRVNDDGKIYYESNSPKLFDGSQEQGTTGEILDFDQNGLPKQS